MADYLVDTDLIIDQLRGRRTVKMTLDRYFPMDKDVRIHFSLISLYELLIGEDANDPMKYQEIMDIFEFKPLGVDHNLEQAARIVRKRRMKERERRYRFIPDSIIAATAIINDFILLSRNKRDFDWIDGLKTQFVD